MYETSWKAKGLVRAAWKRLNVEKDKRGELSRLTGIPPTNLSGMNTGRLPTTLEAAHRIVRVVPGIDVEDLGAPAIVFENGPQSVADRLAVLEEIVEARAPLLERLARAQGVAEEFRDVLALGRGGSSPPATQRPSQAS